MFPRMASTFPSKAQPSQDLDIFLLRAGRRSLGRAARLSPLRATERVANLLEEVDIALRSGRRGLGRPEHGRWTHLALGGRLLAARLEGDPEPVVARDRPDLPGHLGPQLLELPVHPDRAVRLLEGGERLAGGVRRGDAVLDLEQPLPLRRLAPLHRLQRRRRRHRSLHLRRRRCIFGLRLRPRLRPRSTRCSSPSWPPPSRFSWRSPSSCRCSARAPLGRLAISAWGWSGSA
mmetsp:Transcript_31086/g.101577  ORF Transcript_31086/g.101577 Transcript_31086/m.101577 type:complete len:233 (+) Transcript_31086:439-1137(+)